MKITRREFLKRLGVAGIGMLGLREVLREGLAATPSYPHLVVVQGRDAGRMLEKGLAEIGGLKRFVKKGSTVVIKPNASFDRTPDVGANTHPEIIEALVRMCRQAGARRVIVADHTLAPPEVSFKLSGIGQATRNAGGEVLYLSDRNLYKRVSIPKGKVLKEDEVAEAILNADCYINVPVAKVHGGSILTLGLKNQMGTNWDRGYWHRTNLHQCIADFATRVRPHLTILDAITVMLTNGPGGPGELKRANTIVIGTDPVAVDSYGATFFGKKGEDIPHIRYAYELKVGEMNLNKLKIRRLSV